MNINSTLTPNEAVALVELLGRMSFDDFLKLTDGTGDTEQAYFFSAVAAKLKESLKEAISNEEAEYG